MLIRLRRECQLIVQEISQQFRSQVRVRSTRVCLAAGRRCQGHKRAYSRAHIYIAHHNPVIRAEVRTVIMPIFTTKGMADVREQVPAGQSPDLAALHGRVRPVCSASVINLDNRVLESNPARTDGSRKRARRALTNSQERLAPCRHSGKWRCDATTSRTTDPAGGFPSCSTAPRTWKDPTAQQLRTQKRVSLWRRGPPVAIPTRRGFTFQFTPRTDGVPRYQRNKQYPESTITSSSVYSLAVSINRRS